MAQDFCHEWHELHELDERGCLSEFVSFVVTFGSS